MKAAKVTVITITYNHEAYIEGALQSFIDQKTTFPFEVIVADDGSTDGTRDIIKRYAKQYPDIIKPLLRKKNMGAWQNFRDAFVGAKGDYIALCEGDDYWTDTLKLQKQVDFMDKHKDTVLSFHRARVVYDDDAKEDTLYPDVEDEAWYTLGELLKINYIPTASVMYRRQDYTDLAEEMMPGDWYLHLYHARLGKIKLVNEVMSVYRKHDGGIWRDYDKDRDKIWRRYGMSYMRLYTELLELFSASPKKYQDSLTNSIYDLMKTLARVDRTYGDDQMSQVIKTYPQFVLPFMNYMSEQYEQKVTEVESLKQALLKTGDERHTFEMQAAELHLEHQDLQKRLDKVSNELYRIKTSKIWRAGSRIIRLQRKLTKRA